MFKLKLLDPTQSSQELLDPHGDCSGVRENAGMHGVSVLLGEHERAFLCSPGTILAWVWDRPGAFSKEPINFPRFFRLFDGPTP